MEFTLKRVLVNLLPSVEDVLPFHMLTGLQWNQALLSSTPGKPA